MDIKKRHPSRLPFGSQGWHIMNPTKSVQRYKKMETRLTTLRKKNRAMWTQDDYDYVKAVADKHSIKLVMRAGCADCYNEYFLEVCLAEAKTRQIDLLKNTKRKWFLRAGLRVVWNGRKINEGNCNDKTIANLLSGGFPRRLVFSRDELLKKYGIED